MNVQHDAQQLEDHWTFILQCMAEHLLGHMNCLFLVPFDDPISARMTGILAEVSKLESVLQEDGEEEMA